MTPRSVLVARYMARRQLIKASEGLDQLSPIRPGGPVHGPKTVDQGLRRRVQRCPAFLTYLCQCWRTCRTRRRRVLRSPHQVPHRLTRGCRVWSERRTHVHGHASRSFPCHPVQGGNLRDCKDSGKGNWGLEEDDSRGEEGPLPPQLLSDSCRVQRAHRRVEESSWYRLLLHQLGYLGSHMAQDVRIRTTAYHHQ